MSWPLYPILFALSWVLASVVDAGVRLEATLRVLILVPALAAVTLGIVLLILRNPHRTGIAAGVFMVLIFSRDFSRLGLALVGIAAVGMTVILLRRMLKRPIHGSQVTGALNLVSVVLLITVAVQGVANGSLPALIGDLMETPPQRSFALATELPDIYLILLDGYPRADTVRDVLDSDNSEFLAALESRGFTVDPDAHSGYMYTDLAVSSMLHGRHLVDIPQLADVIDGAQLPARGRQVLNEAPLLAALAEDGYTLMANAQAWDEPALRRVHRLVEGQGLNEFERHFFLQSLPGAIWQAVDPGIRQDLMEPWVHDAFDFVELAESADVDGPRFAFIHVPSPHFPIVFTADGGRADSRFNADHPGQVRGSMEETKRAYLGQLRYVNQRLLDALDRSQIDEEALVLVMSDHGPEFGLDWTVGASTDLETRFATLFAVRGPGDVYEQRQSVTGVMVRLLNWLDVTSLPEPGDRFFVNDQWPKYGTLTETVSPWRDGAAAVGR